MRRLMMLAGALTVCSGCFAEVAGGYMLSTDTLPGDQKSAGYAVGINVGVFYDHRQTWRGSLGGGQTGIAVVADDDTGGTGKAQATTVVAQVDYQFVHFGNENKTLAASGAFAYGFSTDVTLNPDDATNKMTSTGSGALDLFGGLTISLPYRNHSHIAAHISLGGEILRIPTDLGDMNAFGPAARIRFTWSPIIWERGNTKQ